MVTIHTNIVFYALTEGDKAARAEAALAQAAFASVQVANEFANAARRKAKRPWREVARDLHLLRELVPVWHSVDLAAVANAVHLANRYQLQFYDALLIAVALANRATTLYSEDMHHGLVVDDKLRIINPFRADQPV